jgi:16S rRNA (cytosine967-C5)-methyltransferase
VLPLDAGELARAREDQTLRRLVVRACAASREEPRPFLSDVLSAVFRETRAGEVEASLVRDLVQALVKYERTMAFALGEAASEEARLDELVSLASDEARGLALEERITRVEVETERLGIRHSAPDWLVALLREDVGAHRLELALARMNEPAPQTARVNTLRTTREACIEALAREGVTAHPTEHAACGITVEGRRSLFRTEAFARGELELQDEASQLVAEVVAPPPRSMVIDACAGAGGKALALAAMLEGRGVVAAVDRSVTKLDETRRRARNAGASNVRPAQADVRTGSLDFVRAPGVARVLVDAPCSGLGAIRRNPEARWRLDAAAIERVGALQRELATAAARWVAPHGRLVFATCSFLVREGRAVAEALASELADFEPVSIREVLGRARSEPLAAPDGRYLETWRFDETDVPSLDGFFTAVFRRKREP